jgi:hypothetical protein
MTSAVALKRANRIRVLNDNFRSTFIGGRVVMTSGVAALPMDVKPDVLIHVRSFTDFKADNDPYGEHDFGRFELAGETFFWKIDYYDNDMIGGPDDPSGPARTTRVLTIMFAEEFLEDADQRQLLAEMLGRIAFQQVIEFRRPPPQLRPRLHVPLVLG